MYLRLGHPPGATDISRPALAGHSMHPFCPRAETRCFCGLALLGVSAAPLHSQCLTPPGFACVHGAFCFPPVVSSFSLLPAVRFNLTVAAQPRQPACFSLDDSVTSSSSFGRTLHDIPAVRTIRSRYPLLHDPSGSSHVRSLVHR